MKYLLALSAFITFNAFAEPVNINTADAETIANSLNGIGIKKAEAIIEHRTKEGDFKSVDDLAKVKGIGEKTVEKNKADIILTSTPKK
ncbi:MAG: ComEA family DNA-binding protein [Methylicorpusculum sp.]|uniref:ComEA family DNA-binding protein n=1 Tax=Methylicorpusculum sp. TaxID=2713644 RepID=UPI00271AA0B6|nr:ComEA family DNA-binding protein [Methylicorpusculum sp.]MDO8845697.1 ComEA family DNA-binding protein [Methylicorpusculum sp.]MDO8938762.1 ComEA family DNA-binding protein [Methylicorpusculum sp.]MDO9239042.1 ComEA family DNA-binding protein [Methylicorpusculum sp.]MDP2176997.1 ComEA family DNA-binding protein [Methylicorpusculum sp.]MDP2201234.1 ComEA family DNA-binding protein [Methylicorpusculum sp.]